MKKLALIGLVFLVGCTKSVQPRDIWVLAKVHNMLEERVCKLEGDKCPSRVPPVVATPTPLAK